MKPRLGWIAALLLAALPAFAQKPTYPYSHAYFSTVNDRIVYADAFPGSSTAAQVNAAVAVNAAPAVIIITPGMSGAAGDFTGISLPSAQYRIEDLRGAEIVWGFKSTVDNSVVAIFTMSASGASGIGLGPAGTTGQLQYNNGGTFGAISGWSTDGANQLTGGSVNAAVSDKGGQVFNVKAYGAKADTRTVSGITISAGSSSLSSSAASPFTSADTGKIVTIQMGTVGVFSGTYTSGITATGSTGQTCTISSFNGGGTSASGYVVLSATNTVSASATIVIETEGTGYTSAPTSATASNGTATCSGTAVVSTSLFTQPVQATATYVDANHLTLSVSATTAVSAGSLTIGSDDSTAVEAAITAANNAGGGVVFFPAGYYLILSQLAIPNNGSAQYPIKFQGVGSQWDGQWSYTGALAASILDMRYSGSDAKILTLGRGVFSSADIAYTDLGPDEVPFILTTNTSLKIHGNSFRNGYCQYTGCQQDAIVLGGTTTTIGMASADAFQGYGTVIAGNFFDRIRRGVYARVYADGVVIRDNTWSKTCGGDNTVAAVDIDGGVGFASGNVVSGNLIEMSGYTWGVQVSSGSGTTVLGDTFWDGTATYGGPIHEGSGGAYTTGIIFSDQGTSSVGANAFVLTANYPGNNYNLSTLMTWPNFLSVVNGTIKFGGYASSSGYPSFSMYAGTSEAFEIQTQGTSEADFAINGSNAGYAATKMKLRSDGGIQLVSATPACDSTHAGTFNYIAGATGVKDSVQVCAKDATDTYAWRAIY